MYFCKYYYKYKMLYVKPLANSIVIRNFIPYDNTTFYIEIIQYYWYTNDILSILSII